jgi:hypothetical protein
MKKVISKGYTITVDSWENDGDNSRSKNIIIENKEEAIKIAKMAQTLFISCNNGDGGIGNTNEGYEDEAKQIILEYLNKYPDFFENQSQMTDEELIDEIMEINYNLMGGSEYYYSRVLESIQITHSPEDIYLEVIKF